MKITEHEMRGLLGGKCLPGDMRLNEELPAYLVRKFDGLQQKLDAMAAEVNVIREQAEDIYAAGYRHGHLNTVDGCAYATPVEDEFYHNALQVMLEVETPDTDAYMNSVRAEGVERFISESAYEIPHRIKCGLVHYAHQLRSGTHDTADKAG